MANFNKSFNFRNGVQVDNDNFIVNANGLVGIGTTIPRDYLLNVYGDSRFTGIVTTTNLYSNVSNVGFVTAANIFSSGVVTATTFYGSAAGLTGIYGIAVDGWYVNSGYISTTSNVGIGTTLPSGNLQIGVGVTINSDGNATYSGIITAYEFSGLGTNITGINASNISSGTLSNNRLPSDISVSGIITAYEFSGFGTNITGINASNISSGTLSNSRLPNDISVSGIITAYEFSGFGTNITGINASNISSGTLSNDRLPSDISISGITTSSGGFVGNLTGTASTAQGLSGNPSISVTDIFASGNISVGNDGNAFTSLNTGNVGIGTTDPTSELQIRKASGSLLEVVSDSGQARISIGQSVGVGNSSAVLRFGNSNKTLDIINNDTGNINLTLHSGNSGINTGRFDWIYGQTNNELMSLTYDGKLGIGITNPLNTIHVVGTSTVTGNAWFGNNVKVFGNIEADSVTTDNLTLPPIIPNVNLNTNSGISTLNDIETNRILSVTRIGVETSNPISEIDMQNGTLLVNSIGVGTTSPNSQIDVQSGTILADSIGIGTTSLYIDPDSDFSSSLQTFDKYIAIYDGGVSLYDSCSVGFGTDSPRSILDFGLVGSASTVSGYFITPTISTSDRNQLSNNTGIGGTIEGAIIYNSTTRRHQGYGSTDNGVTFNWHNLY